MTPHIWCGPPGEVSTSGGEGPACSLSVALSQYPFASRLPRSEVLPNEEAERLNDVKFLVQQLYTTLRIEEHQLGKERELILRLEDLNSQLRPLEKVRYQFLPRDPRTGETKPPN